MVHDKGHPMTAEINLSLHNLQNHPYLLEIACLGWHMVYPQWDLIDLSILASYSRTIHPRRALSIWNCSGRLASCIGFWLDRLWITVCWDGALGWEI